MQLTNFNERDNILYINTYAITKKSKTMEQHIKYMRKPYSERIDESPYKDEINKELEKHPGCQISEFIEARL